MKNAIRMLLRNPGFTLPAILFLAIGIGANAAIFSIVNALLLRPLPVKNPHELVGLYRTVKNDTNFNRFSYPNFKDYRQRNGVFTEMAGYFFTPVHLRTGDQTERVQAKLVTYSYFSVLGITPSLGRAFLPEDERTPGGHPVVVISNGLWKRRFAADPSVIGKTVTLNGQTFAVIGVAPEDFNGTEVGQVPEIWAPILMQAVISPGADFLNNRRTGWLRVVARMKPGVTVEKASSALETIARDLDREHPDTNKDGGVAVVADFAIHPQFRGSIRTFTGMLMAVVGLVLMIACMNLSNLLLVRATARRREIGIRVAMGASRARIVRQLMSESLLVAFLAGIVGFTISLWIADLVPAIRPALPIPLVFDVTPDGRVIAFTLALSMITCIVFGLAPALHASRNDVVSALKDDSAVRTISKSMLRDVFVIGQVAFSLVLLIGSGLFIRSLQHAQELDPGFDPNNILLATLDLGVQGYRPEQGRAFQDRLVQEVRALPEVISVSRTNAPPLSGDDGDADFVVEGYTPPSGRPGVEGINFGVVDSDYFVTLKIPLLQGRAFTSGDSTTVIVNETFAKRFWAGMDPLGKHLRQGSRSWEVVGLARDSKYVTLGESPRAYVYLPYNPAAQGFVLQVRTAGDPLQVLASVRKIVETLDSNLPIFDVRTMQDLLGFSLFPARAAAATLSLFGGIALVLASLGIYAVMAYLTSRRVREIGLRIALGAQPHDVLLLIMGRGFIITGIGIVAGLAGAFGVTRFISSFLYGISPTDPLTFTAVTAVLWSVALAAVFIPARRATRIDPMAALRHE